jgi:hypothetical protein
MAIHGFFLVGFFTYGINPWHWRDVPVLSPPCFSRGAVSLGAELRQWFQWIGDNIAAAKPMP